MVRRGANGKEYIINPEPPVKWSDVGKSIWHHAVSQTKNIYSKHRYPHAITVNKIADEWDAWYLERHQWIVENIEDPTRNVWLSRKITTLHDLHFMPETYVEGTLRFRRKEDLVMFMLRWA